MKIIICVALSIFMCMCFNEVNTEVTQVNAIVKTTEATTKIAVSTHEPTTGKPATEQQTTTKTATDKNDLDSSKVLMSFLGDCMVGSYKGNTGSGSLNWYAENKDSSYFFKNVYDIVSADDITVANCETVLSNSNKLKMSEKANPAFWFLGPTSNANILSSASIEVASVANNHSEDYGIDGYNDTKAALLSANIKVGERLKPIYIQKNNITIGILCCDLYSYAGLDCIYDAINKMDCDYKIIYCHGGKERLHEPETWRTQCFEKLINAGANAVIGHHPHVLQPIEYYNGGVIVYSLGNFCYGGHTHPENVTMIYQLSLTFDSKSTFVSFDDNVIPCYVYTGKKNNYQPALITNQNKIDNVMKFLGGKRNLPY